MANTDLAINEKKSVWQQVEKHLGKMNIARRSSDWRISQDKTVSVFVTFSKIHHNSYTAWYDINIDKLHEWLKYPRSYIIFVTDTHQNTFIIPATKFQEEMDKSSRQPTELGNFGVHIKREETFYITEFQDFNLMNYHLVYHLLTNPSSKHSRTHIIKESTPKYTIEEEDILTSEVYYEGATTQITVNVYERNSEARRKCIQYYGTDCFICGFDFKKVYGQIGEGFVHVHHLRPLSEIASTYILDPIKDLRPVCPNCHAMLHRRKPAYSIEDIKNVIKPAPND